MLRASFAEDGPAVTGLAAGLAPFPFQRGGVAYGTEALNGIDACLIGDDCGLGKTIQALCIAHKLKAR